MSPAKTAYLPLSWQSGWQAHAIPAKLPMIYNWHSVPDGLQVLKVDLSSSYACRLWVFQLPNNFAPWVNDDGMAIAFSLFIVPASLRCCYDITLALYCSGSQQQFPMSFACSHPSLLHVLSSFSVSFSRQSSVVRA